jgi:hypothetical protein
MKFWKRTIFWNNLIRILALLGPTGGFITGKLAEDPFWITLGLICALVSAALAILMVDKDNNGKVDIFEG